MKETTSGLISQIKKLSVRNEIERLVNDSHFQYKRKLKLKGIEFSFPEEDIKPFQTMDQSSYVEYEELNHIRKGISSGWVDTERKEDKQIEIEIRDILEALKS